MRKICFILFLGCLATLTACIDIAPIEPSVQNADNDQTTFAQTSTASEEESIVQTSISDDAMLEPIEEYGEYLNKIWVPINWSGGGSFSFFITQIDGREITGRLCTSQVALPDYFRYHWESPGYLAYLSGTIHDGIAQCTFRDENGNSGELVFTFEDNQIEAIIHYATKGSAYEDMELDGTYTLRPYNISDYYDVIDPEKVTYLDCEFNHWGKVQLATAQVLGNKTFAIAFLTDDKGNVLYELREHFTTGLEIKRVEIEDFNGDGLLDINVVLVSDFDPEFELRKIMFQMEDGLFYSNRLSQEIYLPEWDE